MKNEQFIRENKETIEEIIRRHFPECEEFHFNFGNEEDFSGIDCESNGIKFAIRTSDVRLAKYNDYAIRVTEYHKMKSDKYQADVYFRFYVDWNSGEIKCYKWCYVEELATNLNKAVYKQNTFRNQINAQDFYCINIGDVMYYVDKVE